MSFREKSAWVCFAATIAVFVPYFLHVFRLFEREELTAVSVITAFVAAVVFQIVVQVVAHVAIAFRSRQEQKDERDIAIESKSFRNAYFVLACSCFLAIGSVVLLAVAPDPTSTDHLLAPAFTSQIFLLCFVVAEATKYLTQAVSYRRGS
jgi:Ca2+/H+ antiporter